MKKIILLIYFIFLISIGSFSHATIIDNYFYITKKFKIKLSEGNWFEVRNELGDLGYGFKQQIKGVVRLENNEIMEMIEVYQGQLEGFYASDVDNIIYEMTFKDMSIPGRKINAPVKAVAASVPELGL